MSGLNMSEEEKVAIRKQHEEATKKFYQKKADEKSGLKPAKTEEKPKEKPSK
jgi:hypothetical protein